MISGPTFSMEEHWEAYFVWKRLGFRGGWCWHIDAHLDISRDGLDQVNLHGLASCTEPEEARLQGLMGNSYLPWGGLHCGNYLYPAIQEGMVSRLTWVIPPELAEGELLAWSREHLNSWFELTRAEYASLELDGGRVVGTLLGIPFEMGPIEALAPPTPAQAEGGQPLLVDLDIDYFLNEDGTVWGDPEDLLEVLKPLRVDCLTVAYSVSGGYTPFEQRKLAEPFLNGAYEALSHIYRETAQDLMVALVRGHKYAEALEALEQEPTLDSVVRAYYRGSCLHHLGRFEEAYQEWRKLLDRSPDGLSNDGRAYLHGLCSELALSLGRPEHAVTHAKAVRKLSPDDYRSLFYEAAATEGLGDLRRATQLLRRSLRLAPDHLFALNMRLGLIRLYRRQKKEGLAQIELQTLRSQDVTGRFLPQILLG